MKNMKRKLDRDAKISIASVLIAFGAVAGGMAHKANSYEDPRTEMRQAAREQEEALGIKHFGEPDFLFIKDDSTGLLARRNRIAAETVRVKKNSLPLASYDPVNERIIIVKFDEDPEIAQQQKFHELAHYYHDQLLKSKGYKEGIAPKGYEKNKGLNLIVEGIAENLSVRSKGLETHSIELGSLNFYDAPNKYPYHDLGYLVVTRALNKDLNKGIEVLTRNPPTDEELKDLGKYERKILKMMEKKEK